MPDTTKLTIYLAEYSALRTEITNRTGTQNSLATFTLAATGALGSYAFSPGHSHRLVLLLLVPLNAATGFLWLEQAHSIFKAGSYIQLRLWPELRVMEHSWISSWEDYIVSGRPLWLERSIFLVPFLILFLGPIAGALVSTANAVDVGLTGTFWILDLLVACYFAASWVRSIREFWHAP
jgi:hypothetical protein